MRFLADMGIARAVVRWLAEQGHDAVHLRDEATRWFESMQKAKAEGEAAAARKMLDAGMDRETVLRILGLPPESLL